MKPHPPSPNRFRSDFQASRWLGVKIRPNGFEVEGELHDRLQGRIVRTARIRKLFEDGTLSCRSSDGIRSDDGILCESCGHPDCRPLLRVHLEVAAQILLLDLPHSSARNLIRLADELDCSDKGLATVEVTATVVDRGYWGEVRFTRT